jgi:hypothetical protein
MIMLPLSENGNKSLSKYGPGKKKYSGPNRKLGAKNTVRPCFKNL